MKVDLFESDMEFTGFDKDLHDPLVVADLIYETEPELFSLLFGSPKEKAVERIKKVVVAGGSSFGHEHISLAVDSGDILGLTVGYRSKDINKEGERNKLSSILGFFGVVRLWFVDVLIVSRLLTQQLKDNEWYISNICVEKSKRGKGVGSFILEQIILLARSKGCNRLILDVSEDNAAAVHVYKNLGFVEKKQRSSWLWKTTILKMEKEL